MKQKLHIFAIHQTATSLQRTHNLNCRSRWYPTLDESNKMKSAFFTIHPAKNPPPQNGCRLTSVWKKKRKEKHRFHILHFPNSTGLFTKPTGCHYTKYRFSPDIAGDSEINVPTLREEGPPAYAKWGKLGCILDCLRFFVYSLNSTVSWDKDTKIDVIWSCCWTHVRGSMCALYFTERFRTPEIVVDLKRIERSRT